MAKLTVQSQDCLFCLHPIEANVSGIQEQSKDVYRDIFECSKDLLKDKINFYSEWIYSEEFLSPLCVQCFQSSEQIYEVNQKLIEFKQTLDELLHKLTLEINDRVSKVVKDEDLLEEIKIEDEVIKEDVEFISGDYDKESSPLNLQNETECIDYFYSDADSPDEKEDPLNTDAHSITEQVECGKNLVQPIVPINRNSLSRQDGSILIPGILNRRRFTGLKPNDDSRILNRNQVSGGSGLGRRKVALQAMVNLRKTAEDANSTELSEDIPIPRTNDRNTLPGNSESYIIVGNPTNVISLPVVAYELVNLVCNNCQTKFSDIPNLVNHKQQGCSVGIKSISNATPDTLKEPVDYVFCDICGRPEKFFWSLKTHRLTHNGEHEKPFKCWSCGKGFNNKFYLKRHFTARHKSLRFQDQHKNGGEPQKYICDIKDCSKIFLTPRAFRFHKARYHADEKNLFECPICKRKFKTRQRWQLHTKNHEEKPFLCTTCGKQFSEMHGLTKHSRIHQEGDFECRICGRRTNTQLKLESHMRLMHRLEKSHLCEICGYTSKTKSGVRKHIEVVHKGIFKYKCDTCGLSFGHRANLKTHEETHKTLSERKFFICDICGDNKRFKSISAKRVHKIMFHTAYTEEMSHCGKCGNQFSNGLELYIHNQARRQSDTSKMTSSIPNKCPFCKKTFLTRCDMLLHYTNDHPIENIPYKCEMCHLVFNTRSSFKDHTSECGKSISNAENKCSFCGKAFKSINILRRHEKLHNSNQPNVVPDTFSESNALSHSRTINDASEKNKYQCNIGTRSSSRNLKTNETVVHSGENPFSCSTCGKTFARSHNLKFHEKSHAAGEEQFSCSFCEKTFINKYSFTQHELIHTREKQVECNYCKKTFAHAGSLKIHERIHSGEKPYACTTCAKTCSQLHNLKLHEKTHSGEKQFSCSFCGKSFLSKGNFQKHERIHTGEKPFQCSYCEKAFVQSNALKTHLRIHTGEKPYSCSVCEKTFSDRSTWYKHNKKCSQ